MSLCLVFKRGRGVVDNRDQQRAGRRLCGRRHNGKGAIPLSSHLYVSKHDGERVSPSSSCLCGKKHTEGETPARHVCVKGGPKKN